MAALLSGSFVGALVRSRFLDAKKLPVPVAKDVEGRDD
jgi:hypothetical protein